MQPQWATKNTAPAGLMQPVAQSTGTSMYTLPAAFPGTFQNTVNLAVAQPVTMLSPQATSQSSDYTGVPQAFAAPMGATMQNFAMQGAWPAGQPQGMVPNTQPGLPVGAWAQRAADAQPQQASTLLGYSSTALQTPQASAMLGYNPWMATGGWPQGTALAQAPQAMTFMSQGGVSTGMASAFPSPGVRLQAPVQSSVDLAAQSQLLNDQLDHTEDGAAEIQLLKEQLEATQLKIKTATIAREAKKQAEAEDLKDQIEELQHKLDKIQGESSKAPEKSDSNNDKTGKSHGDHKSHQHRTGHNGRSRYDDEEAQEEQILGMPHKTQTNEEAREMLPPTYLLSAGGEYCQTAADITTASACQAAAAALGKTWGPTENPWLGVGDHRYCFFSDDGWQSVYFNTATLDVAAPKAPKPNYKSVCLEVCTDKVTVVGGEAVEPSCMGVFSKSANAPSKEHAGRSIYENSNGKHLYFWKPAGNWIIESDGHVDNSYGVVFANSQAHCPELATGWKLWQNASWTSEPQVSVTKVAEVQPALAQATAKVASPWAEMEAYGIEQRAKGSIDQAEH